MGGQPFPEIQCKICAKPVDIKVELCAHENGKAVHQDCYVNHITKSVGTPSATMIAIKFKLAPLRT